MMVLLMFLKVFFRFGICGFGNLLRLFCVCISWFKNLKKIKFIRVYLNWFICKCIYFVGIFLIILMLYFVLKLKKYDNSVFVII